MYRILREIGVYSPNDICALEDLPPVPGGDTRYNSLNYILAGRVRFFKCQKESLYQKAEKADHHQH